MSFLFFSAFPLLDKRKVGGDSFYPQQLRSNAKQPSQFSHRITELATLLGILLKSEVTFGLDHLYLLSLFDLHALHYGSLFGLCFFILFPDLGHILGK